MIRLDEILRSVLNEEVSQEDVISAIDNKQYVNIYYDDDINATDDEKFGRPVGNNPKGNRLIEPFALGVSKKGNLVLRAYQINPNTRRGTPKWKMMRLDRITSWKPMKKTFSLPPKDQGYSAEDYNEFGDRTMTKVIAQVHFDNNTLTSLDKVRSQSETLKNAPKVSSKNSSGVIPIGQQRKNNIFTSQPNSKKYDMWQRNFNDTQRGEEDKKNYWDAYDKAQEELNRNKINKTGPIDNDYDEEEVEDWEKDNFRY